MVTHLSNHQRCGYINIFILAYTDIFILAYMDIFILAYMDITILIKYIY